MFNGKIRKLTRDEIIVLYRKCVVMRFVRYAKKLQEGKPLEFDVIMNESEKKDVLRALAYFTSEGLKYCEKNKDLLPYDLKGNLDKIKKHMLNVCRKRSRLTNWCVV